MNETHFQAQLDRLKATFGPNAYSKERVALIWREVRHLNEFTFVRIMDELLGSCRHPPLVPEFRDAMARERERACQDQKVMHRRETENAWPDENQLAFGRMIRENLEEPENDDNWTALHRLIDRYRPMKAG
jgi:hypothetical protein